MQSLPRQERRKDATSVPRRLSGTTGIGSIVLAALSLLLLACISRHALGQNQEAERIAPPVEQIQPMEPIFSGPAFVVGPPPPAIKSIEVGQYDRALPINLATALRLSQARPLIIALAQVSVEKAASHLQGANALWLPDMHFAADYSHHDGANQATEGAVEFASFGSFYSGGGATLDFGVTDALFQPLAARQELIARQKDVQAAQNDALLAVAQSYFAVQEARGRLAGHFSAVGKGEEMVKRIESLAREMVPEMEVDRARALLADLNQQAISSRTDWRVASSRLIRTLRLSPGSVVVPVEPPHLQVTLISSQYTVDQLIPCGLMNRPELASQKALVQATLELLRQERLRPLLPSLVLAGRGPDGTITGGTYGGGTGGNLDTWGGRAEFDAGLVWTLKNLGMGNRALVRDRQADQRKALIELLGIQDRVADEVVQAHAQAEGARMEIIEAEKGIREADVTFTGTLNGLLQIRGAGNLLQPVSRPQEAVAALQQLNRAYDQYFTAVNNFNRAEFQLYHALGYPSRILACERQLGDMRPVEDDRPSESP
jgi:outer membrane protein TolC